MAQGIRIVAEHNCSGPHDTLESSFIIEINEMVSSKNKGGRKAAAANGVKSQSKPVPKALPVTLLSGFLVSRQRVSSKSESN